MHKYLFGVFCLTICVLSSCNYKTTQNKMILVQGELQYLDSHCFGMAPSPEQEKELKKQRPLEGFRLIVKQGTKNDINKDVFLETQTDKNGKYEFRLPKGNYVLLTDYHVDNDTVTKDKNLQISNETSYKLWFNQGLKQFSESCRFDQVWKKKCFIPIGLPYVRYIGPELP